MHKRVIDALEEIDAAVFSGDEFEDARAAEVLHSYVERWVKRVSAPSRDVDDANVRDQRER